MHGVSACHNVQKFNKLGPATFSSLTVQILSRNSLLRFQVLTCHVVCCQSYVATLSVWRTILTYEQTSGQNTPLSLYESAIRRCDVILLRPWPLDRTELPRESKPKNQCALIWATHQLSRQKVLHVKFMSREIVIPAQVHAVTFYRLPSTAGYLA